MSQYTRKRYHMLHLRSTVPYLLGRPESISRPLSGTYVLILWADDDSRLYLYVPINCTYLSGRKEPPYKYGGT